MSKALDITVKLYVAVKAGKWDKADELVDRLKIILDTYKRSC